MIINHNIAAVRANNILTENDNKITKNFERLSSGYKINHAADNAGGLAISQRMNAQISGLSKATNNAYDGISMIQTAEGALEEVNSCLQRMRELAVQASNGIYTPADRTAIQEEVDALNAEITRISDTTEFNTRTLLDGSIDRKSFSNSTNVEIISVSDTVSTGNGYKIEITQDARQAVLIGDKLDAITDISQKIKKTEAGKININGLDINVEEGDTYDEVFKKLRDSCADLDIYCFATDATIDDDTTNYGEDVYAGYRAEKFGVGAPANATIETFEAPTYSFEYSLDTGKDKFIIIKSDDSSTTYAGTLVKDTSIAERMFLHSYDGNVLDIETTSTEPKSIERVVKHPDTSSSQRLAFVTSNYGSDETISVLCNNPELSKLFGLSTNTISAEGIDAKAELLADPAYGFSNTATLSIYGNKITISDNDNFEMIVETAPGTAKTTFKDNIINTATNDLSQHNSQTLDTSESHSATFSILNSGPLSLQIGANANQTVEISIPPITPRILGVDTVNVGTEKGSQKAIIAISNAINIVSGIRAKLGAFQNRLEHATANLDTTNINLSESLARIVDTDMAEEMASYTKNNILIQSGVAMLANCNQQPQSLLSLIQQ